MSNNNDRRVIVALDNMTLPEAFFMTELVMEEAAGVKIGFEGLSDLGAATIMATLPKGVPIFLDPKLHDIPATAALTAKKLARRGAWIINMHCSGGRKMMEAVRVAVDEVWDKERDTLNLKQKPLLIGVALLTSLDFQALAQVGFISISEYGTITEADQPERIRQLALKLAMLAQDSGLDGVVTSPQEASIIRRACGPNFQIVTPGIRLDDGKKDDQVRIATPAGAIEAGANWLVIGRPVTQATDPKATLQLINTQVAEALAKKNTEV